MAFEEKTFDQGVFEKNELKKSSFTLFILLTLVPPYMNETIVWRPRKGYQNLIILDFRTLMLVHKGEKGRAPVQSIRVRKTRIMTI